MTDAIERVNVVLGVFVVRPGWILIGVQQSCHTSFTASKCSPLFTARQRTQNCRLATLRRPAPGAQPTAGVCIERNCLWVAASKMSVKPERLANRTACYRTKRPRSKVRLRSQLQWQLNSSKQTDRHNQYIEVSTAYRLKYWLTSRTAHATV